MKDIELVKRYMDFRIKVYYKLKFNIKISIKSDIYY